MPTPEDLSNAQSALYENEALREDLNDDEAERLLAWGAEQLAVLAHKVNADGADDEEAWESAQKTVRTALKSLDKLVGARPNLDEETLTAYEARLAQCAPDLGVHLSAEQIHAALPEAVDDMPSALNNLLALFGTGQSATPTDDVPPAPSDTPVSPAPPDAPASAPTDNLDPSPSPEAPASPENAQQIVDDVLGKLRGLFGG
jgi:hypothetical protein